MYHKATTAALDAAPRLAWVTVKVNYGFARAVRSIQLLREADWSHWVCNASFTGKYCFRASIAFIMTLREGLAALQRRPCVQARACWLFRKGTTST